MNVHDRPYEIYLIESDDYWYVGSTKIGATARLQYHARGRGNAPGLWSKIQELGVEAFTQTVLDTGVGDPIDAEQQWYDFFLDTDSRTSLNLRRPATWAGYANVNRIISEETRKRLSEAGRGRRLTPEHVQILVECSRNRVWTDEMRERHSEVHRGLKQSPEQVAKRMATFRERGITISEETREKMNASAALNQLTCECGKICRPGPMARHTKASQHKVVQS